MRFEGLPDLQMSCSCGFSVVLPTLHLPIVLNLTYHISRYLKLTVVKICSVYLWLYQENIEAEVNCLTFHTVLTLCFPESLVAAAVRPHYTGLCGASIVKNSQVLHLLLTACRAHVWSTPACLESSLVGDDSTSTISIPVHLKQTTKTVLPWTWSLKATVRLE